MAVTPELAMVAQSCYDNIKKDLEVLEILREHFSYTERSYWYIELEEGDFPYKYECSEEDWENSPQKKIKDWLKRTMRKED